MSDPEYQSRHITCGLPFNECPCHVPREDFDVETCPECGDFILRAGSGVKACRNKRCVNANGIKSGIAFIERRPNGHSTSCVCSKCAEYVFQEAAHVDAQSYALKYGHDDRVDALSYAINPLTKKRGAPLSADEAKEIMAKESSIYREFQRLYEQMLQDTLKRLYDSYLNPVVKINIPKESADAFEQDMLKYGSPVMSIGYGSHIAEPVELTPDAKENLEKVRQEYAPVVGVVEKIDEGGVATVRIDGAQFNCRCTTEIERTNISGELHFEAPIGKSGIAPCGHPGEHIFGNYVKCLNGCDK